MSFLCGFTCAFATQNAEVSENGKKRIAKEAATLDQNARQAAENIAAAAKNLQTISQELKEIGALEKEHLELKKRYDSYLAHATIETAKNERALEKVRTWLRQAEHASDDEKARLRPKMNAAHAEEAERTRWKAETAAKTERVKRLSQELAESLVELRSKRLPLSGEITTWKERKKEYEALMDQISAKRARLNDLTQSDHRDEEERTESRTHK